MPKMIAPVSVFQVKRQKIYIMQGMYLFSKFKALFNKLATSQNVILHKEYLSFLLFYVILNIIDSVLVFF